MAAGDVAVDATVDMELGVGCEIAVDDELGADEAGGPEPPPRAAFGLTPGVGLLRWNMDWASPLPADRW
jgi:hypothetical protein